MAPIKFEEDIREKLEKRSVKPSAESWGKLSERLDAQNNKKDNRVVWWLGIAASIIGVLFIVTKFHNQNLDESIMPKVVVQPKIKENKELKQIEGVKIVAPNKSKEIVIEKQNKSKLINKDNTIEKSVFVREPDVLVNISKESSIPAIEESFEKKSFEEQKIKEVVAQINTLKSLDETAVTNEAIELLLQKAQNEILLDRIHNTNTGLVDANLLLQSVEYELDESFRDKVFKALKNNLNKVKTAVAQRNE